jgi:hypothetical protein
VGSAYHPAIYEEFDQQGGFPNMVYKRFQKKIGKIPCIPLYCRLLGTPMTLTSKDSQNNRDHRRFQLISVKITNIKQPINDEIIKI